MHLFSLDFFLKHISKFIKLMGMNQILQGRKKDIKKDILEFLSFFSYVPSLVKIEN